MPRESLPQEIINLIIDKVALANDDGWMDTLQACSMVSWSFRSQSQQHLFSEITVTVNVSADKRTVRLYKVLAFNQRLLASIRSIRLILQPPSIMSVLFDSPRWNEIRRRSKKTLHSLTGSKQVSKNYMADLLELLAQLPLQNLMVEGKAETPSGFPGHWSIYLHQSVVDLTTLVSRMTSNTALRSLTFQDIHEIPTSLIMGPSQCNSLHELILRRAYFATLPPSQGPNHTPRNLSNITNLMMLNPVHSHFLSFLRPRNSPSTPPSHLINVVVSLPSASDEMDNLLDFMLAYSRSLEVLELQDMEFHGCNFDRLEANYLGRFSALRSLKFKIKSFESMDLLYTKLDTITELLTSATSPILVSSIEIEAQIDSKSLVSRDGVHVASPSAAPDSQTGWAGIDAGLTNPMFVRLRTVNIDLKMMYYINMYSSPRTFDIEDHVRRSLPRICDSLLVKVDVRMEIVKIHSFYG